MLLRSSVDITQSHGQSTRDQSASLALYRIRSGSGQEAFEIAGKFFFYQMERTVFVTGGRDRKLAVGMLRGSTIDTGSFSIDGNIIFVIVIISSVSSGFGVSLLFTWRLLAGGSRVKPLRLVRMTCDDSDLIGIITR